MKKQLKYLSFIHQNIFVKKLLQSFTHKKN
jgi:hypothetical protein